jgi:hypothetical protein
MGVLKFCIFDDFYADPWSVRDYALSLAYEDAKPGKEQDYYKGLLTTPFHWFAAQGIELIGQALRHPLWWKGPIGEFRLLLRREGVDDFVRTWIHSDTSAARYSGLVYLNPPDQCEGGTSFYRHRQFGWDHMPEMSSYEMQQLASQTGLNFSEALEILTNDGFEIDDKWDLTMHIPMRFNRCIVFDGWQFHARTGSFGTSKRSGRLTQNFFFNLAGE